MFKKETSNEEKEKGVLSKKLLIFITLGYVILIALSSVVINAALKVSIEQSKSLLYRENVAVQSKILKNLVQTKNGEFQNSKELGNFLKSKYSQKDNILAFLIYEKSDNEKGAKFLERVKIVKFLRKKISQSPTFTIKKDNPLIQRAFAGTVFNADIEVSENLRWQNIYQPIKIGEKTCLIRGLVSTVTIDNKIEELAGKNKSYRNILFIIALLIVVGIIYSTYLFHEKYSELLKKLSRHFELFSRGEYNAQIDHTGEKDFDSMVNSFNAFVTSIMNQKKISNERDSYLEYLDRNSEEIFSQGISLFKEEAWEEALEKFKILEILRPENHTVIFNLGVIYTKTKKYPEALKMFKRAKKIKPRHKLSTQYRDRVAKIIKDNEVK